MRKDKDEVFLLRKQEKSYKEIIKELNIPKGTLSGWLQNEKWSAKIKKDLTERAKKTNTIRIQQINKVRGKALVKLYKQARKEAQEEFLKLKNNPLFIAGVSIYWGEGDSKNRCNSRIANTNPEMIKLFVDFLIKVCKIKKEKIRAWILVYPDLNQGTCLEFWKKRSGLKSSNFNKTICIKGRHKTNRLQFGVCNIGVSNSYLKEKILEWIKLMSSIK